MRRFGASPICVCTGRPRSIPFAYRVGWTLYVMRAICSCSIRSWGHSLKSNLFAEKLKKSHAPAASFRRRPRSKLSIRPEAIRPKATRPEAIRPKATRPGVTRPRATRPGAIRPWATRPGTTRPGATRPRAIPMSPRLAALSRKRPQSHRGHFAFKTRREWARPQSSASSDHEVMDSHPRQPTHGIHCST